MQIAPIGGAAGTGVSEAKLTPNTGQAGPAAGAGGTSHSTSIQQPTAGDTAVIRELAVTDLLKLTQILQPASPPELVARVDSLMQATVTAINEDRREWAVGRFIEAVTTDPSRAEELRSNPDIQPIRSTVEQLLVRLTNVAKMDAESKLANAEQVIEKAGFQKLPNWETTPAALLQIGHRLLEAGGYSNYVHTAELATTLQSAYWGDTLMQPPIPIGAANAPRKEDMASKGQGRGAGAIAQAYHSWGTLLEKLPRRLEALWQRAPLLVLLGGWFIIGLAGGIVSALAKTLWPHSWIVSRSDFGFQIWGLGLLALVGLGFWARIRKPRRRM
jgi:hypothetical protein